MLLLKLKRMQKLQKKLMQKLQKRLQKSLTKSLLVIQKKLNLNYKIQHNVKTRFIRVFFCLNPNLQGF